MTLRLDHDAHVNYAMQQNAVPVVKGLTLENRGDVDLADLTVEVGAEPGLADPVRIGISRLPAGGSHRLDAVDLRFSPTRLVNQTEREAGEIVVRVLDGETTLAERRWPFEVLAYGERPFPRSSPPSSSRTTRRSPDSWSPRDGGWRRRASTLVSPATRARATPG